MTCDVMGSALPAVWVALAAGLLLWLAPEQTEAAEEIVWTDARQLTIEGKGWTDTAAPYDRLPAKAQGVVRQPVWDLSRDSAGYSVRFLTDSPRSA